MSRTTQATNAPHVLAFSVYTSAGVGVASLTAADFTILLSSGATDLSTAGVAIAEVGGAGLGSGRYAATYTDAGVARAETLEIRPVAAAHFPKAWVETFDLVAGGAAAAGAAAVGADGDTLLEMVTFIYDVLGAGSSTGHVAGAASPGVVYTNKAGTVDRWTGDLDVNGNRSNGVVDHS